MVLHTLPLGGVSADTMILHRSSADSAPILWQKYLGADPGPVVFNARDFQFDLAAGPDLRLIRHGDTCDVEVRYFQIDGWSASSQLEGTFGMAIDTFGIFANDANQQMGWASENNYFGPPYGVSGGIFYHGASFGVTVSW